MRLTILIVLLLSGALVLSAAGGVKITRDVIPGGAGRSTSASYVLKSTASQTAVGVSESDSYRLSHGFWQEFTFDVACDCMTGDANGIDTLNILDIVYLINYLYKGGPAPVPYPLCSGDANCDCSVNVLDITYLTNYLYKGGPAPCSCEAWYDQCGYLRK